MYKRIHISESSEGLKFARLKHPKQSVFGAEIWFGGSTEIYDIFVSKVKRCHMYQDLQLWENNGSLDPSTYYYLTIGLKKSQLLLDFVHPQHEFKSSDFSETVDSHTLHHWKFRYIKWQPFCKNHTWVQNGALQHHVPLLPVQAVFIIFRSYSTSMILDKKPVPPLAAQPHPV